MITRIIIKGYRLFNEFELEPNPGTNIIVGDNESGKSTLLEAIALALTGRSNGRWSADELSPYWFNSDNVANYFDALKAGLPASPPEILIELYLTNDDDRLQYMLGVFNSRQDKVPGVRMHIRPNLKEYADEFDDYMSDPERPEILPTEWYEVDWELFSGDKLSRRPKELGVSIIDSKTVRASSGIDYHTREMLKAFIEPKESAAVSVAHRKARHAISQETLKPVNDRIAKEGSLMHDRVIGLHMDQSSSASWEHSIIPQVADVPFNLAGQGQQAAIKIALAMHHASDRTAFALIEEPENHLSFTSLTKLVARIEALAGDRQVFLTTHSSYVLNRLGLDKLVLLHNGERASMDDLPADTVRYYKRLSGYDTLRLVLAQKVVLVEGPSDEMVFERAFRDKHNGLRPMDLGVDVVSMSGVSLKRGLQLCAAIGRPAAAIRDNDGKDPKHWRDRLKGSLEDGVREVFIGNPAEGETLEPQFHGVNDEESLRKLFDIPADKETLEWMKAHKTEWALSLDEDLGASVNYPKYISDAVEFVS